MQAGDYAGLAEARCGEACSPKNQDPRNGIQATPPRGSCSVYTEQNTRNNVLKFPLTYGTAQVARGHVGAAISMFEAKGMEVQPLPWTKRVRSSQEHHLACMHEPAPRNPEPATISRDH